MARISRDITPHGEVLDVVLSERNLLALLTKLHTPGSACELQSNDCPEGVALVRLRAETDEVHYASATRNGAPAGAVHPLTEAVSAAVKAHLDALGLKGI